MTNHEQAILNELREAETAMRTALDIFVRLGFALPIAAIWWRIV